MQHHLGSVAHSRHIFVSFQGEAPYSLTMFSLVPPTGTRAAEFYGAFYKNNPTDMEFGSIDSESAVAVEIKHDDKLKEGDTVYFQVCCHSNPVTALCVVCSYGTVQVLWCV